jgi:hypothetical protein
MPALVGGLFDFDFSNLGISSVAEGVPRPALNALTHPRTD